jgi:hypothetical protein
VNSPLQGTQIARFLDIHVPPLNNDVEGRIFVDKRIWKSKPRKGVLALGLLPSSFSRKFFSERILNLVN